MPSSPLSIPDRCPSILVVDDEPLVREALEAYLLGDAYQVVLAASGAEAIQALNERPIDLILLDIGLPDIHGYELHRRISKDLDIPMIFLSARCEAVDRISGLELGGDDYIAKPFEPREVLARIRNVLRRASGTMGKAEPSTWIRQGGFEHAPERREIRYDGQRLDLTSIEYGLLKGLLRRPGVVLSREQLMVLAWEDPYRPSDRTVDTHIKNLRAKILQVSGGRDLIGTSRNVGYFLRDEGCGDTGTMP